MWWHIRKKANEVGGKRIKELGEGEEISRVS